MHTNYLNQFVVDIFGNQWAAIAISVALLGWCIGIILYNQRQHYRPFKIAIQQRNEILSFLNSLETEDEAQAEFARRFPEINEAMSVKNWQSTELHHAWREFRETILDETENPLRSTSRPEGYFLHLGDDTRVLAWWANIFVAVGLTCTFLGIVAALTITVESLSQTSIGGNMTPALIELLQITSVKFWTSIAGVTASIILRMVDRRWHSSIQRQLEILCDYLERGTLFSPTQRIAADQLKELKQQSVALTEFSTKLALSIGDALEHKMQPMISVLGGIQASIDDFKSGSFNQIGKELGEALSRNTGNEMQQLATALTGMTGNLASIHEKLEGSGQAAHEQIANAARDFALASEQMRTTFSSLNERIDAMGSKLTEEAEAAVTRTGNYLSEQQASYATIADRNAALLGAAASALETSTMRTSESMGKVIDESVTRASEQSSKAMEAAFSEFGARFNSASGGLIETIQSAAGQMERIAISIERSTAASDRHGDKLINAENAADKVASALGRAATEFEGATTPIREASVAIGNAVSRVQESLRIQSETSAKQGESVSEISRKLSETTVAASKAWADYRDRFENVDKALAAALDKIKEASSEHAVTLNEQTGRIDKALADAIDRLQPALDPLNELASMIEDLITRLQRQG